MASLQLANAFCLASASPSSSMHGRRTRQVLVAQRLPITKKVNTDGKVIGSLSDGVSIRSTSFLKTPPETKCVPIISSSNKDRQGRRSELHLIADVAADRAGMHAVIAEQRDNWNALLLSCFNSMALFASVSAGLATISSSSPHHFAFKLSSLTLYSAATALSMAVNYLQPSQLAEEQRNAARLFRQLERTLRTSLATRSPSRDGVEDAVERVLALDKAYPLALLGVMLEKFPRKLEPTIWWPKPRNKQGARRTAKGAVWSPEVEETMKGVLEVIRRKDMPEFVRLGEKALRINRVMAVCGPLLTGLAAVGALFLGSAKWTTWAVMASVAGGAMATVVNTSEHGGQVGMVFELYRNCAGYYRHVEEEIEGCLDEGGFGCSREEGELVEMQIALQLGRSPSQLRDLADAGKELEEFAGKLF